MSLLLTNYVKSMDTITPVTDYIEGHLRRMSSNALSDGDTLNLVGGEGGIQVDVVFYMVSNRAWCASFFPTPANVSN